jgi:2-polyprenyl-6-methoxyphenol hydroxylase-like FAD-dependent oxidoreductase
MSLEGLTDIDVYVKMDAMSGASRPGGRVAVVGAGPAGMAAALSVRQAGHEVTLLERYPQARPAGNILSLWAPPVKALDLLGVDVDDLGAPANTEFRRSDGRLRVVLRIPEDVIRRYHGGFIGLLRPRLYRRMLDAMPPGVLKVDSEVLGFEQDDAGVRLAMADGSTVEADVLVGADGIGSTVLRGLWGDVPIREHNLHIFGGFTLEPGVAEPGIAVVMHDRLHCIGWTPIRHENGNGFQWWVATEQDAGTPFTGDAHATCTALAAGFAAPVPGLIAASAPTAIQRWQIRDRKPLRQWSKGRVTLIGDAAHPTSPYAAYGAGMGIEDGYFLGRRLAGVDLTDAGAVRQALQEFEDARRAHTRRQFQQAYYLGQMFHRAPRPVRSLRDFVIDHTPLLQKVVGDSTPRAIHQQLDVMDGAEQRFVLVAGSRTD